MKRSKFSETQIVSILKEVEAGFKVVVMTPQSLSPEQIADVDFSRARKYKMLTDVESMGV